MLIGGLDVGTTGCKLTIYNDNGDFIHNEYIEYEVKRQNGEHEIDAGAIFEAVCAVIEKVIHIWQKPVVKRFQILKEVCYTMILSLKQQKRCLKMQVNQ